MSDTHTQTHIPALEYELILLLSLCINSSTASSLLTISIVTPLPPSPRHLGLHVRRKWLQALSTTSASSALTRRLSLTRVLTVPSTFSRSCLHGRMRSTCNFQSTWTQHSPWPESKNTATVATTNTEDHQPDHTVYCVLPENAEADPLPARIHPEAPKCPLHCSWPWSLKCDQ